MKIIIEEKNVNGGCNDGAACNGDELVSIHISSYMNIHEQKKEKIPYFVYI